MPKAMQKNKNLSTKAQYAHVSPSIVTRDVPKYADQTGNVYESIVVIARRANQIGTAMKAELNEKLAEFATGIDNLEEIHENREQIEISKFYERLPKPPAIALDEFADKKVYWRNPSTEVDEDGNLPAAV
jgi:DNA-directed RNA polymerase subunit K/omega